jgi:adenosine deaminase
VNQSEHIERMPKTELHVHLEGAIQPRTLLQLAERNGVSLPAKDEIGLRDFYRYRDFDHFIEIYFTITSCLRTPDDYRLIAYQFGEECARQNIRYAEPTFSIETNIRLAGLPWQAILEGLNEGRRQAREDFGVEMRWIFDIVRNSPKTAETVLAIALSARDQGCVALGLGGSEADYPAAMFTETFARARTAGLPAVPHAGELAGPKSIWSAINDLNAVRLQHGVRAVEDPALVEHLREQGISLDICPTSNIKLAIYPDFASHPLRELWDAGLVITIGSDDPPMFSTSLTQEYHILEKHFSFSIAELEQISLNGLRAGLLPESDKQRLMAEFEDEFVRLRRELS